MVSYVGALAAPLRNDRWSIDQPAGVHVSFSPIRRISIFTLTVGLAAIFVLATGRNSASLPLASTATVATPTKGQAVTPLARLFFESNVGQTDGQVRYFARAVGYTLFLTNYEAVFSLARRELKAETWRDTLKGAALAPRQIDRTANSPALSATVRVRFLGANQDSAVTGIDPMRAGT